MPIHLYIPMEPFVWTKENARLYFDMQAKASECYLAYRNTIGIFAVFSRTKNRVFRQALKEFEESRTAYLDSMRQTHHEIDGVKV